MDAELYFYKELRILRLVIQVLIAKDLWYKTHENGNKHWYFLEIGRYGHDGTEKSVYSLILWRMKILTAWMHNVQIKARRAFAPSLLNAGLGR